MYNIALLDDHTLLRKGMALLIKALGYQIFIEAANGKEFISKLDAGNLPDLVLMDISMPEMDGYETMKWLRQHYPHLKVLVLSMHDDENAVIRMIQYGARGYVLKESDPSVLKAAIKAVLERGYYHSEMVTGRLIHSLAGHDEHGHELHQLTHLKDKEMQFLKLVCTEMTYKEIADEMGLSPRTVDSDRDMLFEKLHVKTRTGLVMFAIRTGIVKI